MKGAYPDLEEALRKSIGPVAVERTKASRFGDFTTNAPFKLARGRRQPPPAIAQELAGELQPVLKGKFSVSTAGGYINFRTEEGALSSYTNVAAGDPWPSLFPGGGSRVLVEFISANPTGPLNVANARAGAVGDSIVKLLKFLGFRAESEYYVNDAGRQIANLGLSVLHFIAPDRFPMPEDGYRGDYVKDVAREFVPEAAPLLAKGPEGITFREAEEFGRRVAHAILRGQIETLKRYGIEYDRFIYESEIRASDYPERVYSILKGTGMLYFADARGEEVAVSLPGTFKELYEDGGYRYEGYALLFRATRYGDDKDRVMVRSNGEPTYFFWDSAYHLYKLERGYDYILDIFGPDHHGYVPRMKAVMRAFADATGISAVYDVIIHGQVNLYEGGERIRMSKRRGKLYTLDDLLSDVGKDAVRFFMLLRAPQTELNFDLSLARKAVKENPVFYTQYAHARIMSLLDYARANGVKEKPLQSLPGDERHVAMLVQYFPYYVLKSVPLPLREEVWKRMGLPAEEVGGKMEFSPNLIIDYVIELSHAYHRFYQNNRIVGSDRQGERITLSKAVLFAVRHALTLLGVGAPDRMG